MCCTKAFISEPYVSGVWQTADVHIMPTFFRRLIKMILYGLEPHHDPQRMPLSRDVTEFLLTYVDPQGAYRWPHWGQ